MSDEIARVIDEICAIDPEFRDDIRGANEVEVQRVEELLGRLLPAVQREFLRSMGSDWGIPLSKADFRCSRLVGYFEAIAWRPPVGYSLLGLDNTGNSEDYFLDEITEPPRVVLFPKGTDPAEYDIEASSLPDFIFSLFFVVRHIRGGPNHFDASKIQEVDGAFAKTVGVLDRLGLPKHPRSDEHCAYYYAPEVSVVVSQPEGYGLGVDIGGPDRAKVEHLAAVLDDHVGFAPGSGFRE